MNGSRSPSRSLDDRPRTGYEVSLGLFGVELKPASSRFAVAETLSHLERLVLEERAERHEDVGARYLYCAPAWTMLPSSTQAPESGA